MKKPALLSLFVLFWISTAYASREASFKGREIDIVPLQHKVYVGHPYDMSSDYYFTKTIDRIFSQDTVIRAKVVDADIDDGEAEFTLSHDKYGTGTFRLYSKLDLEDMSDAELSSVVQKALSDATLSSVVVDGTTRVFHLPTCNHLPPAEDRLLTDKAAAIAGGHRECGICFFKQLFVPQVDVEMAIQKKGSASLRYFSERLQDSEIQSRVSTIGKKVLKSWPYPLIGYDYEFNVVQSREINAFALPAGAIFLTTGLVHSLENDDELEAVIAHEVAHVELRHGLQTHELMVSNQQTQAALQVLGGVAMAAAAGSGRGRVADVIGGVTLASMVAIQIQESGFSKEQETEADKFAARYFSAARKDLRAFTSVFKKLLYHNLCSKRDPDPPNQSHPALGNRLKQISTQSTRFPPSDAYAYHFFHKGKAVGFRVLSITEGGGETELVLGIDNLEEFKDLVSAGGNNYLVQGDHSLPLVVEKYVSTTPWGGVATARLKNAKVGTGTLTAIKVFAYKSFRDGSLTSTFEANSYPTTIDYPLSQGAYYQ